MANRLARVAEHQGARGVGIQQRIDDGVFAFVAAHQHQLVVDVGMLFGRRGRLDTHRIRLHGPGQFGDAAPHRRRKQQRPALLRRRGEDEFQVVAKTEVQHLVGFVEHHRANGAEIQRAPRDVVTQASGRADDEMGATAERAAFGAHVHTAHAGRDPDLRCRVEPIEFPLDLDGKFARRRDDQAQRRGGRVEALGGPQQRRRDGDTEGDRFARAGLRRDQQIGLAMICVRHRQLHGRQLVIAFRGQGGGKGRMDGGDRGCAVRVGTQRRGPISERRRVSCRVRFGQRLFGGKPSYVDGMGVANFVALADRLRRKYGPSFKVPKLLKEMAANGEAFHGRFDPYAKMDEAA